MSPNADGRARAYSGLVPSQTADWDDLWLRAAVESQLQDFLTDHEVLLAEISPDTSQVSQALAEFLQGGKRMRGVLCFWGWRAAGGGLDPEIVAAAASLEFLQACALIHDDVMDGSDLRRGLPAIHRRFAAVHQDNSWSGSPERFGQAAAILLGDLCLSWADELLFTPEWSESTLRASKPLYDLMRTELMVGQYLDVLEQARATGDVAAALRVATFKSGKYSVERPLQLGAALAGGSDSLTDSLGHYGSALGQAFQLRDDLLGVFGEPEATGKPAGDDLREGKRTVLVAIALGSSSAAAADELTAGLGNPDLTLDEIDKLRRIIHLSGAPQHVEEMIRTLLAESIASLATAEIPDEVKSVLRSLADSMANRES